MTRPVSITVVGWVIIALSIEGIIGAVGGLARPAYEAGIVHFSSSISMALWLGGIGTVAHLVLACLILCGFGWARVVYIAILSLGIVSEIAHQQPVSLLVVSALKVVVFGYFFFRRDANEYFARSAAGVA